MCLYLTGQLKDWAGNGGERGNDMQHRPQGGIEPAATAARTQPLNMGRLLYQLNHQDARGTNFSVTKSILVLS